MSVLFRYSLLMTCVLFATAGHSQQFSEGEIIGEPSGSPEGRSFFDDYEESERSDRRTYYNPRNNRGNTVEVPIADVVELCGDRDGCMLRLGMHNWDGTGRVATRTSMFYYNRVNRNWRGEHRDLWGSDADNVLGHVFYEWGCFFTDAKYTNQQYNDQDPGFGLLSWVTWNAGCVLTIVD